MGAMFAAKLIPAYEHKSKSTTLICTEPAQACSIDSVPSLEVTAKQWNNDSDSSSFRKLSETTLLPDSPVSSFSHLEVNCLPKSPLSKESGDLIHATLESLNSSLLNFPDSNVYSITTPQQLVNLLDLHHSAQNCSPTSPEMFPYLHGLSTIKHRLYFDDNFDIGTDFEDLSQESKIIAEKYPSTTHINPPTLGFHLLTVNTLDTDDSKLINSIFVDDLLVLKASCAMNPDGIDFDFTQFEPFSRFYQLNNTLDSGLELINRNYKLQIKLMAPISHFLLYNNEMDFATNIEAAKVMNYLMGPLARTNIYVVDFDVRAWAKAQPYLEKTPSFSGLEGEYQIMSSTHDRSMLALEQNLMWLMNSIKEVFPHLFVGNMNDCHQLTSSSQKLSVYDFKVFIYCHENAELPTKGSLLKAVKAIEKNDLLHPIYFEFPDSLLRFGTSLTWDETLKYLNILKIVNLIVNKLRKNVFVYSFDGFTGTSPLLLLLGLFWGPDHLEEVACCLFRKPQLKLFVTKEDFTLIKGLEAYVQWFKRQTVKEPYVLSDMPTDRILRSYRPFKREIDWFQFDTDVNFPSLIYENLYLGTALHASSCTVMAAINIQKIISVGEKPAWFDHLQCTFEHDATPETRGAIIKPIYRFANSSVYEICITSQAMEAKVFRPGFKVPKLKSIIYIHNLKDDGRDTMLPLFINCPDWIQEKILVNPKDKFKTLVHCRIGVSRSASIAIASVMKHFHRNLMESFLFVRVRRFNVIIQPNLRIFYELYLYDEHLRKTQKTPAKAGPSWWILCDKVHRLNLRYMQ